MARDVEETHIMRLYWRGDAHYPKKQKSAGGMALGGLSWRRGRALPLWLPLARMIGYFLMTFAVLTVLPSALTTLTM